MENKLKILFVPVDATGHINACIGIAQVLVNSGHKAIFAFNQSCKGMVSKYGFEEVLFTHPYKNTNTNPAEQWANRLDKYGCFEPMTAIQSASKVHDMFIEYIEDNIEFDVIFDDLIPRIKPDLIIIDQGVSLSSVEKCGIPWVLVNSCNPLNLIEDERTPPFTSGKINIVIRDG